MYDVLIYCALALLGVTFGSFAGAQVWRIRARQLKEDMGEGESVDAKEYKRLRPLLDTTVKQDRSQCLHCHHVLAWYDLVPLVSWISLRGRCRYCRKSIGWFEPAMEVGVAVFFVASYAWWPYNLSVPSEVAQFVLWLVCGLGLAILLAYDAKWFLLPDVIMYPLIGISALSAVVHIVSAPEPQQAALSVGGAWFVLCGFYWLLFIVSKGRWIGFGDIKLGMVLAFLLADWKLALLALFLANVFGTLVVLPGFVARKMSRTSQIPFGPFLIAGWFVAGLFGPAIVEWYLGGMFY